MIKFILHDIELKPGMVLITSNSNNYIVFPGYCGKLSLVSYSTEEWNPLPWEDITNAVVRINKSVGPCTIEGGETLWEKPKTLELTMDEIAKKFNIPVEYIKIKK